MNKKSKITSLAAATLATVVLAGTNLTNEVKADAQPAGTSSKANSAIDNAKANVESAQNKVDEAQQNVNTAQANLDSANAAAQKPDSDYSAQDGVVSSAQGDVDSKTEAVNKADEAQKAAQKLADEAKKPGAIDKAKQDVTDKSADINDKQKEIKSLQDNDLEKAKRAATDAQKELNAKQDDLNKATSAKGQADDAVKTAEDALKGTGITEAKDTVDTYQSNVNKLNNSIKKNKKVVSDSQTALENNTKKLNKLKNVDLVSAENVQKNAENEADTANRDLTAATNKLKDDQNLANSAAGFFKSLADDTSLSDYQRKDAQTAYNIIMNEGKDAKSYYVYLLPDGEKETVDGIKGIKLQWYKRGVKLGEAGDATSLNSMKSALKDLLDWQKVRAEYGLETPKVSLAATAIAMMSSDFENISSEFDHPINMTDEYGPFYGTEEDIANGGDQVPLYMAEKEYIDNAIAAHPEYGKYRYDTGNLTQEQWEKNNDFWENHGLILYGGGDKVIGHYISMIEPEKHSVGAAQSNNYSSIDILPVSLPKKYKTTVTKNDDGNSSFTRVTHTATEFEYPLDSFSFEKYAELLNSYNPKTVGFIVTDQNDVESKQKIANCKNKLLKSASDTVASINNSIEKFNTVIAKTTATIAATKDILRQEKSNLKTQNENLSKAQQKYNKLTASNKEKAKNLEKAQKAQSEAEQAVKDSQSEVDQAKTKLSATQKAQSNLKQEIKAKQDAVKTSQTELEALNKHVTDLANAPENLDKANETLKKAKADLATAKATLATEQTKLDSLKGAKDSADSAVASAQAAYDQAQSELQAAQANLNTAQNNLKSIQAQEAAMANVNTPSTTKKSESKDLNLNHNAYAYDKNGKAIMKNGKHVTYKKGTAIAAADNGKLVTIKGKKYYQIGENEFIKAANVTVPKTSTSTTSKTTKTVKLTHNAFVYNNKGKVVRKGLKIKTIKRGKSVKTTKTVTIKGKKYYQIGKNEFIKVANTKLKAKKVKFTATIKGKKNAKVATFNRSGKKNKHYVYGKKSYKFNEKITIKGKTYYKIASKNDWVPAKKLNIKK